MDQSKTRVGLLLLGIGLLIFGVRLHLIDSLSYYVPYFDDWGMGGNISLYETNTLEPSHMLTAWNGHMVFWSKLLNFLVFELNQEQWDTQLMMVVNALIWTITGVFLVWLCLRKLPSLNGAACSVLVVTLWLFPLSIQNTLWGVQTHNYLMILFSLLAIWYTTQPAYSRAWYAGLLFTFSAALTMGGGAMVAFSILAVSVTRFVLCADLRNEIKPTLIAVFLLSLFNGWLLIHSSGNQDIYAARDISEFLSSFFKTLSFPLETTAFASIALLAPLTIVSVKSLVSKAALSQRPVTFMLTLFVYTVAIAVAIGYARGADGRAPHVRYFEFLQLYLIVSFIGLLFLQTRQFAIKPALNSLLVVAWSVTVFLGGIHQIEFLHSQLTTQTAQKPYQQEFLRKYLVTKDFSVINGRQHGYLPFSSAAGLVRFLEQLEPLDMLHYLYQVPPELVSTEPETPFVTNGTIRPSKNELRVLYRHENTKGSFHPQTAAKATGSFTSQLIQTKRSVLMIPVLGYLGYPGLTLTVRDEKTGEETAVQPNEIGSEHVESWREIYVDAPANPFRLIATDENEKLWFGFAMPRTVGRLTIMTKWLTDYGRVVWQLGLLLLLLVMLKPLIRTIKHTEDRSKLTTGQ